MSAGGGVGELLYWSMSVETTFLLPLLVHLSTRESRLFSSQNRAEERAFAGENARGGEGGAEGGAEAPEGEAGGGEGGQEEH